MVPSPQVQVRTPARGPTHPSGRPVPSGPSGPRCAAPSAQGHCHIHRTSTAKHLAVQDRSQTEAEDADRDILGQWKKVVLNGMIMDEKASVATRMARKQWKNMDHPCMDDRKIQYVCAGYAQDG